MYITHGCDTIGGDVYIAEQHCIMTCILYIIPLVSRASDYWTNFCIDFLYRFSVVIYWYQAGWNQTAVFHVGSLVISKIVLPQNKLWQFFPFRDPTAATNEVWYTVEWCKTVGVGIK